MGEFEKGNEMIEEISDEGELTPEEQTEKAEAIRDSLREDGINE